MRPLTLSSEDRPRRRRRSRPLAALELLRDYGPVHSLRLLWVLAFMPILGRVVPALARFHVRGMRLLRPTWRELRLLRRDRGEILRRGKTGYRSRIDALGLKSEQRQRLEEEMQAGAEALIGEIDQDGFLLSQFGELAVPTVSPDEFLSRRRFRLQVVARDGAIAVRKDYRGDRRAFCNEVRALDALGRAGCNVPAILDMDVQRLLLTMTYIAGPVVREELARHGARLRDRDRGIGNLVSFQSRISEGKKVLYGVVDEAFVENLYAELLKVHQAGFILEDTKYGNIIIERESGRPFLIDFEGSLHLPWLGSFGARRFRDSDTEMFNLHFDTSKPTYARLRAAMRTPEWSRSFYAPAYIGSGLRIGAIWRHDTGFGRWHRILKAHLPDLRGKRVLDLGSNNGYNSLLMLRAGARQAVAVEQEAEFIAHGQFLKEAFEWADARSYDFSYVQENMARLPELDLGKFDLVTALCSIYYLSEDDMAKVLRHLATITDVVALQCNTETAMRRDDPDTFRKASVEFTVRMMKENGFPEVEVTAPRGYHRPLVVGRRS